MNKFTLIQIFLRCFIVQAAIGRRYMQSLGFAYSIYPVLRELYAEDRSLAQALRRHMSFFHTHTVVLPCIVGCVLRGEIDSREGKGDSAQVALMKDALVGPFSAIGDGFFGASLRPLAAVIGVILAIQGNMTAPVAMILIYNLPNFWFRIEGFIRGLRDGVGVLDKMRRLRHTRYMKLIRYTSALLGGALAALWVHNGATAPLFSLEGLSTALGCLLLAVLINNLLFRGFSAIIILYIIAILYGCFAVFTT